MAQIITVRLQRSDNTPWGFRLQGGKDFGSPLLIQKEKISIEEAKKKNREYAMKLLQDAKMVQVSQPQPKKLNRPMVCVPLRRPTTELYGTDETFIRAKPVPKTIYESSVPVKTNAASILRDATYVYQKKQKEINRLESLIEGAFDITNIQALEEEIRRQQYEENLKEIRQKQISEDICKNVNGNSIAERAGLQAGDAVIRVNNTDIFNLRHKEAQDAIVRAGQNFELTVQRGQQTWKPAVTPVGSLPTPKPTLSNVTPVTKTSLAANKPASKPIGSAHNVQPKPFLNGSSDGPKLVNKQYNSPIGLYSEESIAETLSAQAEVLPTGALGVNFKKNERHYDAQKSEVLKMLQETENEPKEPEPEISARSEFYSHASHAIGGRATSPRPLTPIAQKLGGDTKIPQSKIVTSPQTTGGLTPPPSHRPSMPITQESPVCTDCERVIVGVFVRIKDKNLHVECFKCSTCGTSLKNVGYYNINNKLYCDIHAKLAARSNQPAPNMVPITIPPGGKAPAGAISAALASHAGPLSPIPPSTGMAPQPYTILNSAPVTINGHSHMNGNGYHDQHLSHDKFVEIPALRSENIEMFANNLKVDTATNERKTNRAVLLNNDHLDGLPVVHEPSTVLKNGFNGTLHENRKTYLSEAKINVNNNYNGNDSRRLDAIIDVNNRLQNNKPPPSILGPKPFSSSTAPLSPVSPVSAPTSYASQAATLPRAATQSQQPAEQYESRTEETEIETLSSVEQKISESKQTYLTWPPQKVEEEFPTATPLYIPPTPSNPVLYPKKMIIPDTQIQETSSEKFNTKCEMKSQQTIEQQNENKIIGEQQASSEQNEATKTEENITEPSFQTQVSVCSQEVSQINTRPRSTTECVETITETLGTQMFVEHIKEQIVRPPSPPPPGVLEESSKQAKKVEKQVVFENVDEVKENKVETVKETVEIQDKLKEVEEVAKKVMSDVEKELESTVNISSGTTDQAEQVQKLENSETIQQQSQSLSKVSDQKSEQTNYQYQSEFQQSSEIMKSEIHIQSSEMSGMEGQISYSQAKQFSQESIQDNMKTKTEGSDIISNILNPVPKEWKSPLVTALTTASPTPYTKFSSEELTSLQTQEHLEKHETISEISFPHATEKIGPTSTLLTSNLTIAPSRPFTPTIQTTNEPVPLPEETKPYMPPDFPKTPLPKQPEKFDPKTRMLDALTVAPLSEFKPVTKEIIRQQDDLMKDLPPPPYPNINLVAALTTAPERPFTPVWAQNNASNVLNTQDSTNTNTYVEDQKIQKETERKSTQTCPKIVKAETIKPPQVSVAKPFVAQFPPVSDELKSTFKPVAAYGPSKFSQNMSASENLHETETNRLYSEQNISNMESNQQNFKQTSEEIFTQKEMKLESSKSEQIIEEKVGTLKIQSEQYALRAPDNIPQYQRGLSPLGLPKRAPTPVSAFQEFAKEHEALLSEEFIVETTHPKSKQIKIPQSEVQKFILEEQNIAKQEQLQKQKQIQKSQKQIQETKKEKITKFEIDDRKVEQKSIAFEKPQPPVWRPTQPVQPVPQIVQPVPQTVQPVSLAMHPVPPACLLLQPKQPQIPTVSITQVPSQKIPVQTIQPGQIPPNIPKMTFQPVIDKPCDPEFRPSTPSMSSRPARALTPSLINNPAPIIPYYQLNLSPVKYSAPETNLYDPKSPEVSRAPTPRLDRSKSPVGGRPHSPFGRARSPAAGPPPNPLRAQAPRLKTESSLKEPKQFRNAGAYNLANQLSHVQKKEVKFGEKSQAGQQLTAAHNYEKMRGQTMNLQTASSSQQKSTETSLDGTVQIQRKRIVTEEFERTRKEIDIERASGYSSTTVHQQHYQLKGAQDDMQQSFVSVQSAKGVKIYETSSGKPIPTPPISKEKLIPPQFPSQPPTKEITIKPQSVKNIVSNSFPTTPGSAFKAVPQRITQPNVHPQINVNLSACSPVVNPASKVAITPSASKAHSSSNILPTNESLPNAGAATGPKPAPLGGGSGKGKQAGAVGISPRRGRGILNKAVGGARVPLCGHCNGFIRGPFITALGKTWCPEHFVCATPSCRRALQDLGFVEERGQLYCEFCFEQYLAPTCDQCHSKIKGDCLKAIGKHFHPECFSCAYCKKLFGNSPFFLEDGLPYCEADWNELFTTKCFACGFPVEAGDRWVEALNNNYHSQCFNCTMCKKNLEGQSFYAKGGRPFCKNHAR